VQSCIDEYSIRMGQKRRINLSNALNHYSTKQSFLMEQRDICKKTQILSVEVLDKSERSCENFITGDLVKIEITFANYGKTEGLSVGLRVRNKEGFKIYSWATANYERYYTNQDEIGKIFEEAENFKSIFTVQFEFICNLGSNLYQLETFITYENKSVFEQQEVLDWVSEAGFFRVEVDKSNNFFGGVCDLGMKASLKGTSKLDTN
jgi:lipopolysaccharide transport system ATP-binding protein